MYTEITDDTDLNAEATAAAADATTAINRLSELSRAGEMADMVTALSLLIAADGPLAALGDQFGNTAGWLVDFEDETTELAADRMDDAASAVDRLSYNLEIIRDLVSQLTG